ncbi:BlaI/MecI/CopY family transcriptional regulator [Marivirga sp.]|uniref:BlaI/MecI/CopY family transcriptional regulator n=1 Tax=Marivirga sp. TaxID=2018662 RepID=UPI002D7F79E9|nr:BlaI/MecI/CopY family transcriptional regulator [Marivirga sp.]HET8861238.1 BlaI/MecI/CopY family transcriptional regulator [Marivirga sp.]
MKLSETEEKLMELIWQHKKVFMKELIELHSEPKPAKTTIATLLKRMQEKKFVGYTVFGNSRQYFPLVDRQAYFSNRIGKIIKNYFDDSALKFASFFATSGKMTYEELDQLKKMIDDKMKEQKND